MRLSPADILPADDGALLFGRIGSPAVEGPVVVRVDGQRLTDVSRAFPTARDLCEAADPAAALAAVLAAPACLRARRWAAPLAHPAWARP